MWAERTNKHLVRILFDSLAALVVQILQIYTTQLLSLALATAVTCLSRPSVYWELGTSIEAFLVISTIQTIRGID
ncbi:hypothetical protein BU23DRAFT_561497 [Bimuria novae-zelandiae CBS 107.79]|uniref:Uncharacterized protein n=1 Tax=Bimuria novae-zelandiae CBS 107.79 TaxID=1447943 RepID=A0A6A5UVA9_9PLEO|nr:hypothetical protein BU23DRAFT_561497 [Bimuria novae-zelandiae CBS 107.79]